MINVCLRIHVIVCECVKGYKGEGDVQITEQVLQEQAADARTAPRTREGCSGVGAAW